MTIGTEVAYVKDPTLYGPMIITELTFRGWVWCDQIHDGEVHERVGPFRPAELDLAEKFYVEPVTS